MSKIQAQLKALGQIKLTLEASASDEASQKHVTNKLDAILKELSHTPDGLSQFFVAAEITATPKTANLIAAHVMRPEDVTQLVAERKRNIANAKAVEKQTNRNEPQ
ncbi:MAG: hypothetical protein HRT60_12645 [Dinoroseobacter sp.]|nr:hypothetical protein [Dinoroseobacter sp.]